MKKALEHDPVQWVLAVPLDHSPAELKWFDEVLAASTDVPLVWWGKSALELEVSRRGHIRNGCFKAVRETALEALGEFNMEQTVLGDGVDDLRGPLVRLQSRASDLDPDFEVHMGSTPTSTTISLHPRNDEGLAHRNLGGSMAIQAPSTSEGQAFLADYRWCLDYGTAVTIPGEYIASLNLDLPPGLGYEMSRNADEEIVSVPGFGAPTLLLGPAAADGSGGPGRITATPPMASQQPTCP